MPLHVIDELVSEACRDVRVFLHAVAGPEDAGLFLTSPCRSVAVTLVEALFVEGFGFAIAFALRPEVGVDENVHAVSLRPAVVQEVLGAFHAVGEVVRRLFADEPVRYTRQKLSASVPV